jgi:Holliday junction resolvase
MKTKGNILITKASGEREAFSEQKLRHSLQRVGASSDLIDSIVDDVTANLQDGMTTKNIYSRAFSILRRKHRPVAARYHTKAALIELGPSGHPFEKLVGALLASEGFSTDVSVIVPGICIKHEIDVVAQKGERCIMVECKFHNQPGIKSDVKISLYIQARFEDVERAWQKNREHAKKFHEAWLVTNTKLTSDAADYAACVRMKAIGWNYPAGDGLEAHIDRAGLHPITCLTTLTASQKRQLLDEDIVLCKEIVASKNILQTLGLNESKTNQVFNEIKELCHLP